MRYKLRTMVVIRSTQKYLALPHRTDLLPYEENNEYSGVFGERIVDVLNAKAKIVAICPGNIYKVRLEELKDTRYLRICEDELVPLDDISNLLYGD